MENNSVAQAQPFKIDPTQAQPEPNRGGAGGAFLGGFTAGSIGSAFKGGSIEEVLIRGLIGGGVSLGMYHAMGASNYSSYKKSGVKFDGRELTYRQFMGMSADFQRSSFWRAEFGGVLTESGGYKHRYGTHPLMNPKGSTELHWDVEHFPWDTWTTSHSHFGEPNTLAPDKSVFVQYHSPKDYKFDSHWGIDSFVINRYDASFNSGHNLMIFNTSFIRSSYSIFYYGY